MYFDIGLLSLDKVPPPLFYSANSCVLPATASQIKAFLEIEGPYTLAFFIVSGNSSGPFLSCRETHVLFYSVVRLLVFSPLFML